MARGPSRSGVQERVVDCLLPGLDCKGVGQAMRRDPKKPAALVEQRHCRHAAQITTYQQGPRWNSTARQSPRQGFPEPTRRL